MRGRQPSPGVVHDLSFELCPVPFGLDRLTKPKSGETLLQGPTFRKEHRNAASLIWPTSSCDSKAGHRVSSAETTSMCSLRPDDCEGHASPCWCT